MGKKKNFKMISIITTLFVITTLVSLNTIKTRANNIASQPNFKITDLKATPDPAKVGEDILISGKLVPEDFETTTSPKEIVLVLDVSGSMGNSIIVNGNRTTKIKELKNAAISFIETMKDVPNLKIGIVKYASDATIVSDLKNINDSSLITSINNLSANGGTNIKEGLRKATYLLNNGDINANKTIVLMTDGNPTYYSTYEKLDNSTPKRYGSGSSTDNNTISYTTSFAENQIATRKYNAYSIGYGLDSSGTKYLKQIHSSMKGLTSSDDANEENGFFAKSDGSITEIFTQIAENIKSSYELKEVSLGIGLTEGFTLNIGGNEIKMGNIIYNKVSEDKNTGKIRYHAEPVNFSFIVKGKSEGYQQIFSNIKINYLWEDTIKSIDSNEGISVTINTNELPSISARLLSNDKIEIKKDEEITIKYEITPEDFVYNNVSNSGEKDVVVVLEKGFNDSNIFTNLKNALVNRLVNSLQNEGKTRFSFITFSNKGANVEISLNKYLEYGTTNTYYEKTREYLNQSINNGDYNDISDPQYKDIYTSLNSAVYELRNNSRATANKNIIIIANNDIKYSEGEAIKNIKDLGVNVITLSLGKEEKSSNLYTLHSLLGGENNSIFNINGDFNNIDRDWTMGAVKEKLLSYSNIKPYDFKPTINLNLGNNFNPISGIVKSTESGKNNIGIVEVPTITYNLTQNNNYHAESKIIEIKIKSNNLSPGIYTFGNITDNIMTYKTLLNKDVSMTIKTPIIIVKEEVKNIKHGLYNGINDGQISIQEKNNGNLFEIAQGSTVTFGANFTFSGSSTEFNLNVDNKFSTLNPSDIKIYKVSKDSSGNSSLKELDATNKSIVASGDNKFKISINNITDSSTEILVVYQGKIIDSTATGQTLTNEIVFGSTPTTITVVTPKQSTDSPILPDLF